MQIHGDECTPYDAVTKPANDSILGHLLARGTVRGCIDDRRWCPLHSIRTSSLERINDLT